MHEQVPPDPVEEVDKAVVQSQDLEHQPRPETRVSNTGVKIEPPVVDSPERRDPDKEEQKVVEKFDKSVGLNGMD